MCVTAIIWQFVGLWDMTRRSGMYLNSEFLKALKAKRQISFLILALTGRKYSSIHSDVTRSRERCETPLTRRAAEFTRIWRERRYLLGSSQYWELQKSTGDKTKLCNNLSLLFWLINLDIREMSIRFPVTFIRNALSWLLRAIDDSIVTPRLRTLSVTCIGELSNVIQERFT